MSYRELFHRVISLLSAPGKTWEEISAKEGEGRAVLMQFVYPMIGVCGLSEFIGTFIGRDINTELFQVALTRCCAIAVSLFGGFFLAAYFLGKVGERWFSRHDSVDVLYPFVGYSLVVTFVLNIISGFFPIAILHWILQIYTIMIVFEGAKRFLNIVESKITSYTVIATILILLSPALIEFIFNKLSVILN